MHITHHPIQDEEIPNLKTMLVSIAHEGELLALQARFHGLKQRRKTSEIWTGLALGYLVR
jgi:hypothetical protein